MSAQEEPIPSKIDAAEASRIYFLPSLMTAGNLFCGYLAIIRCIQAKYVSGKILENTSDAVVAALETEATGFYKQAVWLILLAVIFDTLDGRLARLGGRESLFGKEFDSIADIVSFGMAPALMVFFLILSPTDAFPYFRQVGWLIGFIYLLCAAVRLSRFNVITHPLVRGVKPRESEDYQGLPVPAAAGMIASIVLVLNRYDLRAWSFFLPILLLLVAFLMISAVPYPAFKDIGWDTRTRFRSFIYLFAGLGLIFLYHNFAFAIISLAYIFYGLFRHFRKNRPQILKKWFQKGSKPS